MGSMDSLAAWPTGNYIGLRVFGVPPSRTECGLVSRIIREDQRAQKPFESIPFKRVAFRGAIGVHGPLERDEKC